MRDEYLFYDGGSKKTNWGGVAGIRVDLASGDFALLLKICSVDMNLTAPRGRDDLAVPDSDVAFDSVPETNWNSSSHTLRFQTQIQHGNIPASIASHPVPEMKWNSKQPHSSKCRPNSRKKRYGKHVPSVKRTRGR